MTDKDAVAARLVDLARALAKIGYFATEEEAMTALRVTLIGEVEPVRIVGQ